MSSTLLKSVRNVVLAAFLVAGCGAEPIPVDLESAAGPCEYGQAFMKEGMTMVMQGGRLTVVEKEEGSVRAAWADLGKGPGPQAGCEGCH